MSKSVGLETTEWQRVSEQLLSGVLHEANSRLAALTGISRMARMGVSLDEVLLPLLDSEISQFAELMRVACHLPRGSEASPRPVELAALASELGTLYGFLPASERVEVRLEPPGELPPVRAGTTELPHALLTLLWMAGRYGRGAGAREMTIRLSDLDDVVALSIQLVEPRGGLGSSGVSNGGEGPAEEPNSAGQEVDRLAGWFESIGAELRVSGSLPDEPCDAGGSHAACGWEVRLPIFTG